MNSTEKQKTGQIGEDLACEYLIKNRYKIMERNFKRPWGEIDIIVKDPNKTLVFVEVKAIRQYGINSQLTPEDQMTAAKLRKVAKTASLYAGANPNLINQNMGWRIDLVAITLTEGAPQISHYKNITK